METLGERLKYARECTGESQIQAAEGMGLDNKQLSKYENNRRKPDPETLALMANYYKADANWLLGINSWPKPPLTISEIIKMIERGEVEENGKKLSEFEVQFAIKSLQALIQQ